MKINHVLDIYPLFEANIFNIKDEYEGVSIAGYLKQFIDNLPGIILQQQFTKKVAHLLVNDERFHYAVRQLPANAPEWAQKAVAAQQLYAFKPTTELNDTLSHITHYLAAAAEDSVRSPSPDQKVVAARALAALPKAENIDTIKQHADEYFKRGSRKAEREVTGMEKVFDAGQDYIWYKLTEQDAYRREGKVLQNCIGTIYTHARAEKEKEAILILKNPSGESIVAMRVHSPTLKMHEVKGKNNRPPIPKYMPPVVRFINHMKLKPSDGALYDLKNAGYYYDKPTNKLYTKAEAIQKLVKTDVLAKVAGGLNLVRASVANQELFNDLYGSMVGHGGYYGYSGDRGNKYDVYELRDANNLPRATAMVQGKMLKAVQAHHQSQSNQQPVAEAKAAKAAESQPTSATMLLTSELLKRGLVDSLDKGIQRHMLWKDKVAWNPEKGAFDPLTSADDVSTDDKHIKWKVYTDPNIIKQLYTSLQKADDSGYGSADVAAFARNYKLKDISAVYVQAAMDLIDDSDEGGGDDEDGPAETTYVLLKANDGTLLPLRAVFTRGNAGVLDKHAGFKGVNSWEVGERDQRVVSSLVAVANKQGADLPKTFRVNHGIVHKGKQLEQFEPKAEKLTGTVPGVKISLTDLSPGDRLAAMSYLASSKHTDQEENNRGRDDSFGVRNAIVKATGKEGRYGDDQLTDTTKWKKGEIDEVYQKIFGQHTPDAVYVVDIEYGAKQKARVAMIVDKNTVVRVDGTTVNQRWQKWADYDTVTEQLNKFADEQGLKYAPNALLPLMAGKVSTKDLPGEMRVVDGKVSTAATEKKKSIEALRAKGKYQMEGTDELKFADGVKMQRIDPAEQAAWVRQTMHGEGGRGEGWKFFDAAGKPQAILIVDGKNMMSMYSAGHGDEIRSRGLALNWLPYVKQAQQTFGWVPKGRVFQMRQNGAMYDILQGYSQRGGNRRRQWLRDVEKLAVKLGWLQIDPESRTRRSQRISITPEGQAAIRRLAQSDLSVLDYITSAALPKDFVAPKRREMPKPEQGTGKYKISLAVPRGGSKAEAALEKFRTMTTAAGQPPSRSEFMQAMMAPPFNMSKFGAQTYYYTTKAKYAALGESFSALCAMQLREDPFLRSFRSFLA